MPKSGNYKEMVEAWEKVTTSDGVTVTRKFHDKTEDSGDLPWIGDYFDKLTYPYLFVKSVTEKPLGGLPDNKVYIINYETMSVNEANESDEDIAPELLPINGNMSGEVLAIDGDKSGFTWDSDDAAIDQRVYKNIVTGAFAITRKVSSLQLPVWAKYQGAINSSSFKGIAATFVLFDGVDWEEYFNSEGEKRWKVNFNFVYKLSNDSGTYRGWNYLYREKTNVWDKTKPVVYASADFNKLLADRSR